MVKDEAQKKKTPEKKGLYYFRLFGGILLFFFGLALLIYNFFIAEQFNGYQVIFGAEFIAGSYFFAHGMFKGFKNI